jgi:uncharacterized protein (DUF433 family)
MRLSLMKGAHVVLSRAAYRKFGSGLPVVRGTRIKPDAIVDSYDLGETIDELHEGFPSLSISQIKRLIEFAHTRRDQQP